MLTSRRYWAPQHLEGEYHLWYGASGCLRSKIGAGPACYEGASKLSIKGFVLSFLCFPFLDVVSLFVSSWASHQVCGVCFYPLVMEPPFPFLSCHALFYVTLCTLLNVSSKECLGFIIYIERIVVGEPNFSGLMGVNLGWYRKLPTYPVNESSRT